MSEKKHAVLSASSAHRWLACPPSALACAGVKDTASEYAQQGTDAHSLCEYKLLKSLGQKAKDPTENLTYFDEEMADCSDAYTEFVQEQVEAAKQKCADPIVLVEQRLDFSEYVPEGFGTGDCVIVGDGTLSVIDFKYGVGIVVEAERNPQMMCYALGALALFDGIYDIDTVWRCNHKYDDGKNCSTPHLDEETIKALYLKALRILGEERDEIIATFEAIKDEMYDTAELETEQAALQQEVMVVTELVEQCISENAHVAQNQKDYQKKYDALSERYDRTKERLDKVSGRIMERQAKREMIEAFLHDLAEMDEDVQEFTDDLWFNLLDYVTVFSKKDVRFTFKNGTEISVK